MLLQGLSISLPKEADEIDGWELSTRGGSYDTQQYNLLYGKKHNDLEVVLNYNYFNTHGLMVMLIKTLSA